MSILNTGDELNKRYKIKELVGEGGFGEVYKVFDRKNGNIERAVKVECIPSYVEDVSLHRGEPHILRQVASVVGVPEVFDVFVYKSRFQCYVIPLYAGDLVHFRRTEYTPKTTMRICFHALKILRDVHDLGFVHRDIKLSNLMVPIDQSETRLVLIDFGMARQLVKFDQRGNRVRVRVRSDDFEFGSSSYSAHRMCQGHAVTESEDLEMVAYALLAARDYTPFYGQKQEMLEQKIEFLRNPLTVITNSSRFLLPILKVLIEAPYGQKPDYDSIMKVVLSNGYLIKDREPFRIQKSKQGKPFIE